MVIKNSVQPLIFSATGDYRKNQYFGVFLQSLSEDDQEIVEICGAQGTSVMPANFDQMKKLVKVHDAEDSGSHE